MERKQRTDRKDRKNSLVGTAVFRHNYENPLEVSAGQRRKCDFGRLLQNTELSGLRFTVKYIQVIT